MHEDLLYLIIAIFAVILIFSFGMWLGHKLERNATFDGTFYISATDDFVNYRMDFEIPMEEIPLKKTLLFKVKQESQEKHSL